MISPSACDLAAKLPADIMSLAQVFTLAGYEIALVGGPVRDACLGLEPKDFDLTTNARPEETEKLLETWADTVWDVGKDFGTIGARRADLIVEITTYRAEEYDPNSRKPAVAYGKTLEGDLTRRDFTVNAMALRLPELELVDPTGGIADLVRGILRTPIDPQISFTDDPLRIMRAARFAAQLKMEVEEETMHAMSTLAERLKIVSVERVQSELSRLLTSPYPRRGLELLVYTGVADLVLPEFSALQDTVDEHRRHKDVYEHTLVVLQQAMDLETDDSGEVPAPDLVLRLAAILHDIGKPATRRFEPGGTVSFHQHDIVGAKMAAKRLRALRFDKQTVKDVSKLVALHLRFHGYGEQAWSDAAVRRYVADAGPLLSRLHRLTRADVTTRNKRKAAQLSAAYDDLESRIADLEAQEELNAMRPDLDGKEIMGLLGLGPGPQVGAAYKYLLALRIENGPLGYERAREELLAWWSKENGTNLSEKTALL